MRIDHICKLIIYFLLGLNSLGASYFLMVVIQNAYYWDNLYSGLDAFRFIAFPAVILVLSVLSVVFVHRKNLILLATVSAISLLITLFTWFAVIGIDLVMGSPPGAL